MSKTIMSRVVQGNSFDMEIEVFQPVYISDGTIWDNFDITQCTNVNVNLICEKDNVVIPLQWAIKDGTTNVIVAHVIGDLLHSRTTYALELTGLDSNEQEWRYKNDHIFAVVDSNDKSILDTEIIGPLNINARIGLALYVQPVSGPQGPQGSKGDKGDVGATGAVGPQGPAGQDGLQGATGPAGQDGATGPQGAQGDRGETGPQGAQGAKGADGTMSFDDLTPEQKESLRGPQGFQGEKGAQGDRGATGATGAVGPQGEKGDVGATGAVGPQGDRGETGPQGPAGQDGLQGATGPAGQDGATGPQGAKGATGATGAVGPQGNQGPIGATGPQGAKGETGATGVQGPQGNQGPAGADGATGVVDYTRFATVATSGSYNDLTDKPSGGTPGFTQFTNPNDSSKIGLVSTRAEYYTTNIGNKSIICGDNCEASGQASFAVGFLAKAKNSYAHAEGYSTQAGGEAAHAEGYNTNAGGKYSHAEGSYAKAYAQYSHAEGYWNEANGEASHAEGYFNKTYNNSEHACGNCNISTNVNGSFDNTNGTATLFSVGNGMADNARHNALEIKQNGDLYYQKVGGQTAMAKLQDVMVTAVGVTGLKIEVVSAMPQNPDNSTLYIVQ